MRVEAIILIGALALTTAKTYSDPSEAFAICAADATNSVLVAHEHCNKFYKCDDGKPVEFDCYGILQYNTETRTCDWPQSVDCGARIVLDNNEDNGDNEGDDNSANGDNDNGNGSGAGNCDPSLAPAICAADGSDNILVAHENCNKFYICSASQPVAVKCPGNLLFNPAEDVCDWPEHVDCSGRVIPEPDTDGNGNGDNGSGGDNGGSDNGDNGNGNGSGANNCDPSEAPAICAADGSDNILVAHENCNKFYICSAGQPVAVKCPGNLLFNPAEDVCDWPKHVDCSGRVIPEPDTDGNGNGDNGSGGDNGGSDNGDNGNGNGSGTNNCDPSEAPAICAADGSDNILVAHENCNKFYICSAGQPVAVKCPGNLLFNPAEDICDWPENVNCGDRVIPEPDTDGNGNGDNGSGGDNGGSDNGDSGNGNGSGSNNCDPSEAPAICAADGSDNILVAHENCNKFYICSAGQPVAVKCPGNLLFNPAEDVCDWPENVNCGDRVIPKPDTDGNGNGDNGSGGDNGGSDNGDSGNGNGSGSNNCDPSEAPAICAADGSDNILVAHENCNKFYICSAGQPVAVKCPSNLLFNPAEDVCDWPENVDCSGRVIPEPDTDGNGNEDNGNGGDNGGSDNGDNGNGNGSGANNCDPSEAPAICAADGSDNILVAHENCNKFYICSAGQPVAVKCPGNLLFNPAEDICDWPENVNCGDRVIIEPDTDGNGNGDNGSGGDNGGSDNGDSGNGNGSGSNNCDPSEAPAICAADGSDNILVAHENCNKFYICSAGQPVAVKCPGNLLFNPAEDVCDWPENVNCGDRVISEPDTDGNGNGDNGSGGDNGGSDNGDSGNGNGSGSNNYDPSEAPAICAADGSDNILVAHENCNKFYICSAGQPVDVKCPGNLLFNPSQDYCDWPENVDCGDRVIPEPETDSNGNEDNGSSGDNGGSDNGDNGNGNGSGSNNCDPSEAPAICGADGSDNILVAHENCNKFYICSSGQPVSIKCPGNLLFNPAEDICDWPENVDCGDRIIPEPESEDNGNDNGDNGNGDHGTGDNGNGDSGNGDGGNGAGCGCNNNPSEAPAICAADGSDGILVAHEKCNNFYTCVNGAPVSLSCPGNLLYNPSTEQCDWPENVECGDRVIPEEDTEDNGNEGEDNGNGGDDNGDGNNGGDGDNGGSCGCNDNPSEAPAICATDGSDGVLVAHENCNKFYTCVNGAPFTLRCPGNLLYNPITEQCDWPENVECGDRVIPEGDSENNGNGGDDNDSENGDNGDSDNGNGDGGNGDGGNGVGCGCNNNPSEAPAICAADGSDGILVAHEKCNNFYTCVNGAPVTLSCPGNLLYNPSTEQCDWPENVECGDRVIPEEDTEDNGNEGEGNGNGGDDNGDGNNGGDGDNGGSCGCNDNPSEAPAICATDGSDGVLVAHENCNKFYTCVNGAPFTLRCPGNLLYNPITEQCDWPENVECGDRVIPEGDSENNGNGGDDNDSENGDNGDSDNGNGNGGNGDGGNGVGCGCNNNPSEAPAICAADGSDGILVAHEKCNNFYTCVNGAPVTLSCPGNLLYNPSTEQCDWPENVECGDRVIPEEDTEDNGNEGEGNGNGGDDNGDGNNGGDGDNGGSCGCNDNPSEAPAICATDGSDGVLVAHENCNKFYTCVNGAPFTLRCPGNLLYNPITEQCDWPENVECGDRVIPEGDSENNGNGGDDNDSENGDNGDSDNGNGNGGNGDGGNGVGCGCNNNPSEAPAICAADDSDGILVAHEKCNNFYTCVNGAPVSLSCPGNLLYNPSTEQCDWPENVECGDRVIPEEETEDNGNEGEDNGNGGDDNGDGNNGGDGDNGGSCGCNDNPSEAPAICATDGSDGVLVAHENCNKFYTCVNGAPFTLRCPGNLLYNPITEQCDWPENIECGDRVIPEGDSENNGNGGDDNDSENGDNGDSDNGNGDGGNGDGGNGVGCGCNNNPSEAPAICAADDSDGILVAHEKCNNFYTCVNGAPVSLSCPGNLLYNPSTEQCDWPENVECGDRVIPEEETEDNGNEGEDNGNGGDDNSDGNNGGDGDNGVGCGCNDNPSEAPAICALDGSDGVFVAHEKCNKFYTCVGGSAVTLRCPVTLLYNPRTEQCDWPENVECGERVISEDDGEGNNGGDEDGDNEDNSNNGNDNPSEAPAICAAEGSDGVLVTHENCNQFYTCSEGRPVVLECPTTTLFNPGAQKCDWPENVNCGDRIIPDDCKDSNGNSENDNGDKDSDNTGNNEDSEDNSGNGANVNDLEDEATTLCGSPGSDGVFLPHANCHQFYICNGGKPVILDCSSTTLYDPSNQRCDWPQNVDCGTRILPLTTLVNFASMNKHLEARRALKN